MVSLALAVHNAHAHPLLALLALVPLLFSEWFQPVNALFLGLWNVGAGLYDELYYFANWVQYVVNNAWAWLKALLTWTRRALTALLFTFSVLWENAVKAGLQAASGLFAMLDNIITDVFRPVHIVLAKLIDYAIWVLISGTISGLAVIPDFVNAIRAARPHLITWAQAIETALYAHRQDVADAFGLVRDRVNTIVEWTNGLIVPPGRLHVGALMYALVEYLPWWMHSAVVFAIPDDLEDQKKALLELYEELRTPIVVPRLGALLLPDPVRLASAQEALLRAGGLL